MKLLMISGDRNVAAGKSGAFSETLKEFHEHFERIDILCPRVDVQRQIRSVHGNVYLHPASGRLVSQPSFVLQKGRELFREHRHDVMTVHDYPPFYNGVGARWLKKSTGIPAVLEIHHVIGWPKASSITELVGRFLSQMILPSHCTTFDAVRTVNGTVKTLLVSWGVPEEHIHVIPSFYLDHVLIESSKRQPKTFDLVTCSRLVDNKGLISTLDALALLPQATLLVVGDGPLKKKLQIRAQKFGNRVTFTGWLPTQADVLKHVASGKIFVMNSASEGGPRAALEAMALGLPILTTRVGVMPDVVTDRVNGLFTDSTSRDIATKASTLLLDPARMASMGEAASLATQRFERHAAICVYADFLKSFSSK